MGWTNIVEDDRKRYRYIARGSVHRGHTVVVKEWKRGKIMAYCCECEYHFYGLRRCVRKIKGVE